MKNGLWQYKSLRTMILAATPLFCLSIPAIAQNAPAQNNTNSAVQDTRAAQSDRGQDTNTNQQQTGQVNRQDNGINHGDLVVFDRFLDSHPEIAQQVRKDPSLLDNRRWVHEHQALETFLQNHSQLRGAISSNPKAFMQAEQRYDVREDARGTGQNAYSPDRDRDAYNDGDRNANTGDRDANVRDRDANASNRDQNGAVNQDRDANASNRNQDADANRDRVSHGDLVVFDHFLDRHPEIAEQLRKNPSLVDNRQFVQSHPALQNFLQDHSQLRGAISSNPSAFMYAENRYDNGGDRRGDDYRGFDRSHVDSFHDFMGQHREIARDISSNPDRVNDQRYVDNHPELKQYLSSNPGVRQDLSSNPQTFVNVAQTVNVNVTGTSSSTSNSTGGSVSGSGNSTSSSGSTSGSASNSKATGTTGTTSSAGATGTVGGTGTKGTSSTGSSTGSSTSGTGSGTDTTTKPNK